jgi:hypothetical protein
MSRDDPRAERSVRPAHPAAGTDTAATPLVTLLAHATGPSDLLPHLHQQALDRAGGVCSLLFQQNPRNGALQATSGFGLEVLRSDPWLPDFEEAAIVTAAFDRRAPVLVADAERRTPDLASRLGRPSALLVPLVRGTDRVGLLAIGFAGPPPPEAPGDVAEIGHAVLTALELLHLRQGADMQRDVRALLEEFSASLTATLSLAAGLDIFCHGANLLFGADRASVLIHVRRARQLVLHA